MVIFNNELEEENKDLFWQLEDLKQKANEFKMLYLENLKYKEQVQDLTNKGLIKKQEDERMHF